MMGKSPCPWSSRIGYDCELHAGHEGDHVDTDLDGKSKVGWSSDHRSAYRRPSEVLCIDMQSRAVPLEARANHVHPCPVCYEREPCLMTCAVEPDMTLDDGTLCGSHVACASCVAIELETLREAVRDAREWLTSFADQLSEHAYQELDCHLADAVAMLPAKAPRSTKRGAP